MSKSKIALIIISSIMLIGVVTMSTLYITTSASNKTYKNELSNLYLKNMYNFVENVEDIEVNMSKLMATSSIDTQRELLNDIYVVTSTASVNISNLPLSQRKSEKAMQLLNRLGGFTYSLLEGTYNNKEISSDDYRQLEEMYVNTKNLLYDINQYVKTTKNKYDILKYIDFGSEENSSVEGGIYTSESSASKLPSLIYDGPFSDSVINKEIKGLESTMYEREVVDYMLETYYPEGVITYQGDSDGRFATFNYKVTSDNELYVSVTKQGGMLITVTGYAKQGEANYSVNEGVSIAQDFAARVGFKNMYSVWTMNMDSVLYVNLAPIIDHVIYYPDLVKVKVDLNSGAVIGLDATNYAYNHTTRETYKTITSILDGDKYLNERLKVLERNYVVIPNKYVGESMAYEYICEWQDYTYYVYLDINDFTELNIMRVIDTASGSLIE
ncbi:MAG: germination protein YpeB [Clostridia bacterium]|nr:germination protein YpeB [Clostridia bacterium]